MPNPDVVKFRQGKFYEIDGKRFICSHLYSNGWGFRYISRDFITQGDGGRVMSHMDPIPKYKEIFREVKKSDLTDELFKVALKIASSQDIDEHMTGQESGEITSMEHQYRVFSKFWAIPRSEEVAWLDKLAKDPGVVAGISSDVWDEDFEEIEKAMLKIRMVKQYVAEMKYAV